MSVCHLNFKIPRAVPAYVKKGTEKILKVWSLFHKNTKCLHAIAGFLYLIKKYRKVARIWSLTPQLEILRPES
jgi:hypothetical protein